MKVSFFIQRKIAESPNALRILINNYKIRHDISETKSSIYKLSSTNAVNFRQKEKTTTQQQTNNIKLNSS
ncbi:unnamed protein product [Schistosoma mattheei]|uniref:Uncharacterized protein n=1 Tax=Schistosoma mattheei TaxID=31246 RepID=A0A183Q713_9TREM|nr:unnamed protein product [Schistosoma mattheei]